MRLLILSLLFSINTIETSAQNINTWKISSFPDSKNLLYQYSFDTVEWQVFSKDDEVFVRKYIYERDDYALPFKIIALTDREKYELKGSRKGIKVEDGFIVCFNRGEWGSYLYWFSNDGNTKEKLGNYKIVNFLERDKTVYALESNYNSSVIMFKKIQNKWSIEKYLQFPSKGYAMILDNDKNLFILSKGGLFYIDKYKQIETLIDVGLWSEYFTPNSMVIKKNIVYIGMQKGVVKYNIGEMEEWLLPE